ncbi:unnamed protein product [Soboliphyme baturini]|uniref:FIP-RBD domain-containing protein n=1 Tax=Soboliphyme baturini TaxID=241478 RepID=A0A183I9V6_9BILA|nr:unnamed protein product [Soboliphyme baturini]
MQELIEIVEEQKVLLSRQHNRVRELEEYIDRLVFKVMASHPELLQIPDNNFRSGVR